MSQAAQVIQGLLGGPFVHAEGLAAFGSAIVPGDLVELTTAGEVQEQSTANADAMRAFALSDLTNASDIDTAYSAGSVVRYGVAHSGQEVFARVAAAAAAIDIGDALEAAGDGTLRVRTTGAIVAYALEAVDNSGGVTAVRIKARVN